MSTPLEHDYIGLSGVSSMQSSEKISTTTSSDNIAETNNVLNLKATELRLGLPGSESPERSDKSVEALEDNKKSYPLGVLKSLVSGAKRGFSDAIDNGSGNWVFSGVGGSESDSSKNCGLFSPRVGHAGKPIGGSDGNTQQLGLVAPTDFAPQSPKPVQEKAPQFSATNGHGIRPAAKAQVVGWPPIRSFRKNTMANKTLKNDDDSEGQLGSGCIYVKVSMDGAPYLRKVDLKTCCSYMELSSALEKMFSSVGQCSSHGVPSRDGLSENRLTDLLNGSEYVLTYEDKDGDWMLVGDVPWEMFTNSCKRLRIMKSSDAIGLAPRAIEKCKNRN